MVLILWIYTPQIQTKLHGLVERTKNATFLANFLYFNVYSAIFTTINNDISIYIYNEIKITIHFSDMYPYNISPRIQASSGFIIYIRVLFILPISILPIQNSSYYFIWEFFYHLGILFSLFRIDTIGLCNKPYYRNS